MNDRYPMDRQILLTISRMDSLARQLRHRQVDDLVGRLEALAQELDAHRTESLMARSGQARKSDSHASPIRSIGT